MQKRKQDVLILLIYSVPYVFFGMLGDVAWHSLLMYVLMMAAMVALLGYCMKTDRLIVAAIGNLLSVMSSCLMCQYTTTEKWDIHFDAYPCMIRALQFSVIFLAVQAVLWWTVTYIKKEKDAS